MAEHPDPLAALAELPGVAAAVDQTRAAVDAVLWPRNLGSDGPALAVASRIHGAQACAAIDGIDFAIEAWRSGDAWEDSAMGRIAAGTWRGYVETPALVAVWRTAPLQALARLHALVARDTEPADDLGRPRQGEPDDPLRLGGAPAPAEVTARLSLLGRLVGGGGSGAPALVEAAVVHGELLSLRPFSTGSGIVARLATRLVMAARGLDPDNLTIPEVGIMQLGRPAYVRALKGYASGEPGGVVGWIDFIGSAIVVGCAAADEILVDFRANGVGKSR